MMTAITKDQAQKLAAFIASVREDWDPQGITAALGWAMNRGNAWEIAVAAIRAAALAENRTPAVIAQSGSHWRSEGLSDRHPSTASVRDLCAQCSRTRDYCQSENIQRQDRHKFETIQQRAERVKRENARKIKRENIRERHPADPVEQGVPRSDAVLARNHEAIDEANRQGASNA